MKEKHCYRLTAGTWASPYFDSGTLDDRTARRKLARWIRLCWQAWRKRSPAGSMADAENSGWHAPPVATVRRVRMPGVAIPCDGWRTIDSFELTPEAIAEFVRVWDPPRKNRPRGGKKLKLAPL